MWISGPGDPDLFVLTLPTHGGGEQGPRGRPLPRVKALSAPVQDQTGAVVASLSISGLTAHLPGSEEDHQLAVLRSAAASASRALGHSARDRHKG